MDPIAAQSYGLIDEIVGAVSDAEDGDSADAQSEETDAE
jgi:hypothetical protein